MSFKLFRQFMREHLRQYVVVSLVILLAQLGLVLLLRDKYGLAAEAIKIDSQFIQVIFVLCLLVLVVMENLDIMKTWTNTRYRVLPVPEAQLYFVNLFFAIFNQLLFFVLLVFGWFLWGNFFLPMFAWPSLVSLGKFVWGMVFFCINLTVFWQGAGLLMLSVTQQFFTKLRPVIGIACFLLISTFDSFISKIGRGLDNPVDTASNSSKYTWLWTTPFEGIFATISMALIITLSIYLLKHYTEAESRKDHG